MKLCQVCKRWLLEEADSIPMPDTFVYKTIVKDGITHKIPAIVTKYPEGFCSCEEQHLRPEEK